MAYKKKEIYAKAKDAIEKNKLFFIEDIVSFLPISKKTFYQYFPIDSNESNELKEMLETNRVALKVSMRKKWYNSNSPALQMALMKLIATPEELRILAIQYQEQKVETVMSAEERERKIEELLEKANSLK
jgi:ACT domain-containing protein